MKMKSLLKTRAVTACVFLAFTFSAVAKPKVVLTTTVLNATTQLPQESFSPGETVAIEVSDQIPATAVNHAVNLSASAGYSVFGIEIPIKLLTTSNLGAGASLGQPTITGTTSQGVLGQIRFKIPHHVPVGTLQITIGAVVKGVGTAVATTTIGIQ
jgi:hypothetical protein